MEGGGDIVYMGGDIESGIRRRGIYGNPGAPFRDGEVHNLSHQKLKYWRPSINTAKYPRRESGRQFVAEHPTNLGQDKNKKVF